MSKNNEIIMNDVAFTYSITRAPKSKPNYKSVLVMHIIDPETCKRLKKPSKSINIDEIRYVEIAKFKYIKSELLNEKDILKIAKECAKELYIEYESTILRLLKKQFMPFNINFNQLYVRYKKEYFKTKKISSSTLKEKERVLKKAAENLPLKPISELKESDLDLFFRNQLMRKNKNMIKDFFAFCKNVGAYSCVNPFENYLAKKPFSSREKKIMYTSALDHIPKENEEKFHKVMLNHLDDAEFMLLPLTKCFKISLTGILSLKWESVIEIDGNIIIREIKNNSTNFHDFSRPVLQEGSDLIKMKYELLLKQNNQNIEKIKKMKVIPLKVGKKGYKNEGALKSHLTKYLRNCLIEAGLNAEDINSASKNCREVGGSGLKLMNKNYDHILVERCGLDLDSPEGRFMRGLIPGDTSNMFYRSMSDAVSGIPFFLTIARRDDLFSDGLKTASIKPKKKKESNRIILDFEKPQGGKKVQIIIPKTFVKAGDKLVFESVDGIEGNIKHFETGEEELKTTIIY